MRAIQLTEAGGPEVLRVVELPAPGEPAPGEIRVRVKAAGVNPVDAKIRQAPGRFGVTTPLVPGCDGAGVVTAVGEAVQHLSLGDEVYFCQCPLAGAAGSYAEEVLVDARLAARKPAALDFAAAAAVPLVLITAWEALVDRAQVEAGQRVLVHGGAGGVGHMAIQIARLHGAQVIATAGSAEKAELARALGAQEVVLHRERDFVSAVLDWTGGRGVDLALDTVGGEVFTRSLEAVACYGRLMTLLAPPADANWGTARTRNLDVGFELMLSPLMLGLEDALAHQGRILDRCREWFDDRQLRVHVDRVFPLDQAAEAHALLAAGAVRGKLVLEVG